MAEENHKDCINCPGGAALKRSLLETDDHWAVCDAKPLIEGHIEVISKEHISCMGTLDDQTFSKYAELYQKVMAFMNKTYGKTAVFEHGIIGQTVFHAHTHFLPFSGLIEDIVPEKDSLRKISKIEEIRDEFVDKGKYLYVAIDDNKWLVDTSIGFPRFFRDRFAKALGVSERGNWKKAKDNPVLVKSFEMDVQRLKEKWACFFEIENHKFNP